jgi:small basic protein
MAFPRKKPETRINEPLANQSNSRDCGSGLVAETLFMAVLLHALLALVLVDLGLTTFLDGAHSFAFGVRFR